MYNYDQMTDTIIRVRNPRLLDLTVYLILTIMVVIGFISLPDVITKVIAIALCVAFGLVHAFGSSKAGTPGQLALYFGVQVILILALMALSAPSDVFNLLFYVLGIQAVVILPSRAAITWITGFFLLDSLVVLWTRGIGGIIAVLFYAAAFTLTAVFGYALRQAEIARRRNQELLEELKATQRQLRDLAVMEERTRMAREMHDSLGHRLTVSIVQLEGAQRLIPIDPERAARMIGTMRDEMKEALRELRRTVSALRVPVVEDPRLDGALSALSQTFQHNTGIPTHFSVSPNFPGLPETHRLALYRAAQEGLTNIQRHAMARNAWLNLDANDQIITLVIEDDGKGINGEREDRAGSGLLGLRERAVQLGGELQILDRHSGGTQLNFSVPLPKPERIP